MPVDIRVPAVGESITEGRLSRWFQKDGATVQADQPLYELETEKATTEIVAPATGVLHVGVPEGETVAIGTLVGRIEETAAAPPPTKSAPPPAALAKDGAAAPVRPEPSPPAPPARESPSRESQLIPPQPKQEPASPAPSAAARTSRETRERMSSIRQRIAERLVAAQQAAATLTTFNEADLSAIMAARSQFKDTFKEKHGVGLGFMSFFVKAAVAALKAFPLVNARIDGPDIVYQHFYDIGVAVSTERGLMVPVLRDADRLSFAAIEKAVAELAEKARQGKIAVGDLQGGTFTITNGGVFGSMLSTPILNSPQSAILGMHAITKRPMAVNNQVVIRPMMYLALTYDHRLIDGREAVLFLARIKECLEKPERMLLEV